MDLNDAINRDALEKEAVMLGASKACLIRASLISVEERLAEMCRSPGCSGYGKSANCPPYVMGPAEARDLLASFEEALFFKLDVEPSILMSYERFRTFERVFHLAAALEGVAERAGYGRFMALGAGSCKPVFCSGIPCAVLEGRSCKYPSVARPSMEALGINVFKLAREVGWPIHRITKTSPVNSIPSAMVAGMVLLGRDPFQPGALKGVASIPRHREGARS
jgi:predicted metal-binding protein